MEKHGLLTLVPTPIGNLQDITLRAIEVLRSVDLILCEDTRISGQLMKKLDIKKPMESFHLANEHKKLPMVINRLISGLQIAQISDAGTPGISDPGFLLVRACVEAGISVECLPGPTAFVPALVLSGLPCERFHFEGFLPPKKGRKSRLEALSQLDTTLVFYESPHRLLKTLKQFIEIFGTGRQASVSREISKMFEETRRGSLSSILEYFSNKPIKGEFVLVIAAGNQ